MENQKHQAISSTLKLTMPVAVSKVRLDRFLNCKFENEA